MSFPSLPDAPRLLIKAVLEPAQGGRFQPTGFPDIGAATWKDPRTGDRMLLVESAQSIANRLEAAIWDESAGDLVPAARGLPFVRVREASGAWTTTSLHEAHRLNSVYVEKSDKRAEIEAAIGFKTGSPFDRAALVRAMCRYDVNALLHGVFLESIAGVLRLPRALSGFVEARGVEAVASGGVKNDRVAAGKDKQEDRTAAEGFGNVPFHREEYAAREIAAFFNLDLDQIRSYDLGPEVERLLYGLALFKVLRFLDRGLRLRTACDLGVLELAVTRPVGLSLPPLADVDAALPGLIRDVPPERFNTPAITDAVYAAKKKAAP
jgi:CRISPR-associated protein Csb1